MKDRHARLSFFFAPHQSRRALVDAQQGIERESAGAEEHDGEADRQQGQRQLDSVKRGEELVAAALRIAESIGELHDERGHEHRAGEEERIESREKPGDQKDGADQLGVRGDVAEKDRDAVRRHVLRERCRATGAEDFPPAVREEDQPRREPQQERAGVDGPLLHVSRILGPIALLCAVYLATVFSLGALAAAAGWPFPKWIELLGIVAATGAVIAVAERGRWSLGLAVAPRVAAAELLGGALFAAVLIVAADRLIALSEPLRHARGSGFPCLELVGVFLPAALHEELVFRGYAYQKLRTWSRAGAIAITSGLFAGLHGGNWGITPTAMANLLLAGVLLALAYERRRHLWLPIGIHIGWNVASGPLLGYGVSGYVAGMTVMTTSAAGPPWITGGAFGIEGSVWTVVVELAGIAVLLKKR